MRPGAILWGSLILAVSGCAAPASSGPASGPALSTSPQILGEGAPQRALFDAEGYRIARFRAPVDRDPSPARHMSAGTALRLVPGRDALFVDVLPVDGGWRDPASGAWAQASPHVSIPGAIWHPETGRTPTDPRLWAALRKAISRARQTREDLPVVVFCRADCWMSWNVARRLAREGVTQVFWYEEGIEGWRGAGRLLAPIAPVTVRP